MKNEPLNEAIELKQAIENKDIENIKEEIGDILYDACLIASIAEKEGITSRKEIVEYLDVDWIYTTVLSFLC